MTLPHNSDTAALADAIILKLYKELGNDPEVVACINKDYGDWEERGVVSNKKYELFQGVDQSYNCNGEAEWLESFKQWGDIKDEAHLEALIVKWAKVWGSYCMDIRNS